MEMIMITAPSSGEGKTLITLGIIRALKNRNIDISGFKTGGDFLDTKYLSYASGKRAGNLDTHLIGVRGLKDALSINKGDMGIIEGAMGYFDGMGDGYKNSSYDISKLLDINAILVYTPRGEMFSTIPKIKGMVDFSRNRIKGIILNKVNREMYLRLQKKIKEYIDVEVLGFMEKDEDLEIEGKSLGLAQDLNRTEIDNIIEKTAFKAEKNIDIDRVMELCRKVKLPGYYYPTRRNIKIAIAYDKAFAFYYNESLSLFENTCDVEYFSPMDDESLPQCDLLYISGGETYFYRDELAKNHAMTKSIKEMAESGGFIYGESGGLMYLAEYIDESSMCGIFKGKSVMTDRLQRFGYVNMELKEDCILGKKGDLLKGNEFHKSTSYIDDKEVLHISKSEGKRTWKCGYKYKNVLIAYPHINFLGNKKAFCHLLDYVEGGMI